MEEEEGGGVVVRQLAVDGVEGAGVGYCGGMDGGCESGKMVPKFLFVRPASSSLSREEDNQQLRSGFTDARFTFSFSSSFPSTSPTGRRSHGIYGIPHLLDYC